MPEFSNEILEDYKEFNNANQSWDILSYINMKYDANTILSVYKLLYPDFIEHDECIFISFLLNRKNYTDWKNACSSLQELEKIINSFEINDYFSLNNETSLKSSEIIIKANLLAQIFKESWNVIFLKKYPHLNYTFKIYNSENKFTVSFFRS